MVSLKKKQSGFTIVELLIVIVIIGILAGLVIVTFVGIQQRARNSERQTDINSIASQLEGYFADNSGYPSMTDLNSYTWRNGNNVKLGDGTKDSSKVLADPSNPSDVTLVAGTGTGGRYAYQTEDQDGNTTCASPTTETGESASATAPCVKFTLTATYEDNKNPHDTYVKKSAND